MRELAPQDSLNLPHDADPIWWVPAQTWVCQVCDPEGGEGAYTTVAWVGELGRCNVCGSKFRLADAFDKHVPTIVEQGGWRSAGR
jgi:hypothetical protein